MRIIFCYTKEPDSRAAAAIEKYAPDAEFVATPGLFDYNEAIASRWTGEDDLVVIEGDKEITGEVIPAFSGCDEPWCTFAYEILPLPFTKIAVVGLGCAKFSAECQRQISTSEFLRPDYPMAWPCPDCDGAGCWRYLDTRIATAILNKCITFAPHVHGRINHYHEYPPDWAQRSGVR